MTLDKNQKHSNLSAKEQIVAQYERHSVSAVFRQHLVNTLADVQVSSVEYGKKSWVLRHKVSIFSSVMSALAAASITFSLVNSPNEAPRDPIAELAQLPVGHKLYPPDFDLDGDSANLNEIIHDIFADKNFFVSDLPPQIVAEYAPAAGRFFSWDGEPAVSIEMNKNNVGVSGSQAATLFIVKLSEKSKRKFPKEKQTRKVAGKSGHVRKVKVWREGNFGYAMLQENPVNTP